MKTRWYDRRAKEEDRRRADRREPGEIANMEELVEKCTQAEKKLLDYVNSIFKANGFNGA